MRTGVAIQICLLIGLGLANCVSSNGQDLQTQSYGPEVRAFLDFLHQEEEELAFQISHSEIDRRNYIRSKNRIAVHRQTVLNMVKEAGTDYVPELHVVATAELNQLIENGAAGLKGIKRGDVINQKWRYLGSVSKGEVFYIFERVTSK